MPYVLKDGEPVWTDGFVEPNVGGRKRSGVWMRYSRNRRHTAVYLSAQAVEALGSRTYTVLVDYKNRIVCLSPGGPNRVQDNGRCNGVLPLVARFGLIKGYKFAGKKHKRGLAFYLDEPVRIEPYKKRGERPIEQGNNPGVESV